MTQRFVDNNSQPMPSRTRTSLLPLKAKSKATEMEGAVETLQHIVFKVNNYLFALPSQDVLRVVAMPSPEQGGFVAMGMVQLGPYNIQILDLVSLLELKIKEKNADESEKNPPFLLVLQGADITDDKSFLGIALQQPPDLMEVPVYALKPVPAHQRLAPPLKWVSHVVRYDLNSKRRSLLILDLSLISDLERGSRSSASSFDVKEIAPPLDAQPEVQVPFKLQDL